MTISARLPSAILFCAFRRVKQRAKKAHAHPPVNKRTSKACACLSGQDDPGNAEGLKTGQPLRIEGVVELGCSLRPLPPGNCRPRKVAGDAAVFKPVGNGAPFCGCAKTLGISPGPSM